MTDTPALIDLSGVTKVFLTDEVETHALSGIHLKIQKGEFAAIAGPSGCGKSTLLSILGLLDSPTDGQYILNGQPVAKLTAAEVATYVVDIGDFLIPALMVMMTVKFALVVGFFMHLRFDSRLLTWVFVAGLALAIVVYIVTLTTFEYWQA